MEKKLTGSNHKLGILGGGQLGRMIIQEALNLDIDVHILDPDENAPCSKIATTFSCGSITEFDSVYHFGKNLDTLTVEIENVNIEALYQLEAEGVRVFPQPRVLELIKDKGKQKEFYKNVGIPTAPFKLLPANSPSEELEKALPCVQKLRTGGYDGKGVQILRTVADLSKAFQEPSVVEELIPFTKELSVIVARNEVGDLVSYPVVECEFNDANLVEFLFAPATISAEIEQKARTLAEKVITKLELVGLLAVELFLTQDNELLVNEIAPRPHNSGHHTIECNACSQFQQHLRSVMNLPLGSTEVISAGAMLNITGEEGFSGRVRYENYHELLKHDGVHLHLYGKAETKPNRKMGHITITGSDIREVFRRVETIRGVFRVKA